MKRQRRYYTIRPEDIGKRSVYAFGRHWLTSAWIGRIMPQDVGKRVYEVGSSVQVENNEQRDRRLG